jgi:cobyrinic acid a,c-diamide synthase
VRVFKTGPDFIDPMFLEQASGHPVYQLDLWMVGEVACQQLLFEAAGEADLILIEGVMGLFDGLPSSADLAQRFGVPVLVVMDVGAMAETFGAIVLGLASYRKDLPISGALANRVAGPGHAAMLKESLPEGIRFLGGIAPLAEARIASRHLGLVQAQEIEDLNRRLEAMANMIGATELAALPRPVMFNSAAISPPPRLLEGVRIAIARDAAFSFIYPANIDWLWAMGARVVFFSPLQDGSLPEADSLYLPGGYPELYLEPLGNNAVIKQAIRAHAEAGKPILAECGGMMYLLEAIRNEDGHHGLMCGILPGIAHMQVRLAGLGTQSAVFAGVGELRGHTFHHSHLETPMPVFAYARREQGSLGEAIYRQGRVTASYLHWYLSSCPEAAAALLSL